MRERYLIYKTGELHAELPLHDLFLLDTYMLGAENDDLIMHPDHRMNIQEQIQYAAVDSVT